MALGIACAGTGMKDAMAILDVLCADAVDFVRQGALISSALVLMQQPDVHPTVKTFREKIAGILKEKHPSTMTKMGAVLAHGDLCHP